jgi:uncharacterized membrane protein
MMTMMKLRCGLFSIAILATLSYVSGFIPIQPRALGKRSSSVVFATTPKIQASKHDASKAWMGATPAMLTIFAALPAQAAAADGGSFILASAFVAYAHYASLLTCAGVLVAERLTVSSDMTFEQEELLWKADALYGISGLVLTVSGYYRVVEYGKGWEFYSHEPFFWIKMALVGIWGASSFFPTIIILKRVLEQRQTGTYPSMSEKLANRMTQVINAELLAIAAVPLTATLMSRGVLYNNNSGDFSWQAGAVLFALCFGGFGFKYAKEALTWTEDDDEVLMSKVDE